MKSILLGIFFLFPILSYAISFGVWSEWTPYAKLQNQIEPLAKKNLRLHLAVKLDELQDQENLSSLIQLLLESKRKGLEVWGWPLLARNDGYWLSQWNAELYSDSVKKLILKLRSAGAEFYGISMDLEPPPEVLEVLIDSVSRLKFKKINSLAKRLKNDVLFHKGENEIQSLAIWLKHQGLKTHLVTTPILLSDSSENRIFERTLGIPLVTEPMDYVSFMSYRSEYERIVGKMNSRMIYEHSKKAFERYGSKASMDLGVVGNITFPHVLNGYSEPKRLWEDIAAAQAGGIERIQVYCLEGMDDRDWLREVPQQIPGFSLKSFALDRFFRWLSHKIFFEPTLPLDIETSHTVSHESRRI